MTTTPLNGLLTGTVITALIQSSTAVTVFSISLVNAGLLSFEQTLGIILGTTGTCFTALLAAIGGDTGAKRVAVSHLLLNLFGVMAMYPFLNAFAAMISWLATDLGRQVAHAHTLFNVGSSLALPVVKPFANLVRFLVPER